MRQDLGDEFLPVLTHETVHALNERKLNWDDTSSSYFEEGTSTYVEFLVQKKLYGDERIDRPPRELFGEDVRFDPDPTDNYYNTLPPKGDADVLWGYYQNDEDFMKQWNPFDSPPEYRSFGYAYSELVIKNHIVNANGSVRDLYSQIDVDREISDPEEKWSMFSEHVDLTPCKHETREEFDECLENINSYNYTVYSAEPSQTVEGNLDVRRLEVPEREEVESDSGQQEVEIDLRENVDTNSELNSRLNSVFEALRSVLDRVVGFIQTEF